MSRRMLQRHKHLLSPLTPAGDVILHNREAASCRLSSSSCPIAAIAMAI